jgi:hypothetical protein
MTLGIRHLFRLTLQVPSVLVVGAGPEAFRRVGVVGGGTFEGDRLKGEVLTGNDWQQVRTDHCTTVDVRLVLRTHDGALVEMSYRGLRHGPKEVMEKLDRGDAVDPSSYYFRISARFETSASGYDWLNRVVAIGTGDRRPTGPVYQLFELT